MWSSWKNKKKGGSRKTAAFYAHLVYEMWITTRYSILLTTRYRLEKLPNDRMSDDELELLAPWNEAVKAEIKRRANESNQSYVNCQGAPTTEK